MPYSDIIWEHKDPLLIDKLNQMQDNTIWTSEHRIIGGELAATGTSTVEIQPLKLDIDGVWLQEGITANLILTAENNAHWREGTSQEGSSTAFFVFAYNSNSTVAVKFCSSAPAYSNTSSGTAMGPKIYDKSGTTWSRCLGQIMNGPTNALIKFKQVNSEILYDDVWNESILNVASGTDPAAYADVDASLQVPPFARKCSLNMHMSGDHTTYIRRKGSQVGIRIGPGVAADTYHLFENIPLDSSRIFELKSASGAVDIYIKGYTLDIR